MRTTRMVLGCAAVAAFCAVLICAGKFYAQPAEEEALAADIASEAGPATMITGLEVKGNKTISDTTVLSKIKSRAGLEYSPTIISEDIKRLYSTGYFSDVKISREDYEGGFKIIFELTEKPLIESIEIQGSRSINKRRLNSFLTLKAGEFLDEQKLKEDIGKMKDEYIKRGFSSAGIIYTTKINEATSKAAVIIVVDEGHPARIKKISFVGNKVFKHRRLAKVIKSRPDTWLTSGFYKDEVLREDAQRLEAFYQREGFIDATAEYKLEDAPKGRKILVFTITEGTKYTVGSVAIEGNKEFDSEKIRAVLTECTPGKVFGQERMDQDATQIQTLYFDAGYISAQAVSTTAVDPATGKVSIVYTINEGVISYVNRINIIGNIKTKDVVVRRELRLKPGERFDGEKLRRSRERLRNLGFFEDIAYDIEPTEQEDKKDLVVEVKEAKTGSFSFGGGYSSIDQFVGFVELEQRNFDFKNFPYFTGDGQNLRLHAELGTVRQEFMLSFTEPWFLDYPVSFGFDGYKSVHYRESDVGYGYDEKRLGGDVRFGKEFSEYVSGGVTYRLEDIEISNVVDEASSELKKEIGKNTVSSLDFVLARDTRDNVFDPTRGTVVSGQFGFAGGPIAGDKDFWRFVTKASWDIPCLRKSVLEFRGRAGVIDAYGDSSEVPIYERFFTGGATTIRGYNERKVGPIDPVTEDPIGGESMFVGNIEYTIPLVDFIRVAAFFDTGNTWAKMSDLGKGGFKSGTGLGLRIKTPIGPVNLDYGIPLSTEPGEEGKSGKFYFSMSHGF